MLSFSLLEEKRNYSDNMTRSSIQPGDEVLIVLKKDQRTGKLTRGIGSEFIYFMKSSKFLPLICGL